MASRRTLRRSRFDWCSINGCPALRALQRELIIPFGGTGYVALYEIVSASKVVVLAVRRQREEDCH
jgi:hypothetical protein